jgi:von Willebrand factor type A domain
MKRVDRSILILTMSALDTLATAIGVFVLLVALLMPYYQNSFDLEATITQLRVAHEQNAAQLEDINEQIAEESAKAAAALMEAQQVSAEAAAIEAKVHRQPEPSPKLAGDTKARVVDALDLVFVIDTTASMGPMIRDLAASMRSIVRVFERMVPSVRIGISAYKDHDIPLPPLITFPLTDANPFLPRIVGFLDNLEESPIGSRTIDEDVHLGLEAATLMHWRPDAKQVLVLIGDAEAHPEYVNETFWRVQHFVQGNKRRSVSTLFVTTPSSLSAGQRARPYFQALAKAANGTFNDHTGSMMESVLLSVLTTESGS